MTTTDHARRGDFSSLGRRGDRRMDAPVRRVNGTLRVLSLTGVHPTQLPASVWRSFGRRVADLQALFLNEPWFFGEGLLYATLSSTLVRSALHRAWIAAAIAGCLLLSVVGVLSGLGVIGSVRWNDFVAPGNAVTEGRPQR